MVNDIFSCPAPQGRHTYFTLDNDFTCTVPVCFYFGGMRCALDKNTWKDVCLKLCALLAQRDPTVFDRLADDARFTAVSRERRKPKTNLVCEMIDGTDVYISFMMTPREIVPLMRELLDIFGLPLSAVSVEVKQGQGHLSPLLTLLLMFA